MSVEEHPLAEMQRRTCEVPNRGHRAPCQPIRASIRTALLPFLVGAAVLVSACMPLNVVEDRAPGVADSQARSARSAALETARLEPGPPPQPLPEAPVPEKTETLPARGDDTEMAAHDTEIAAHDEAPLNQPDVWARMRRQFTIARPYSSRVQRQAEWFRHNHDYFDRVAERSRDYLPYIVREAERRGLPLELALLPVIESAFQPFAYSPARASGLWQFIPSTARLYGLRINWWYDGRRDLMASTSAAFDYLEKLHRGLRRGLASRSRGLQLGRRQPQKGTCAQPESRKTTRLLVLEGADGNTNLRAALARRLRHRRTTRTLRHDAAPGAG